MRKSSALMVVALLAATTASAFAREAPNQETLPITVDPNVPGIGTDFPARTPQGFARVDTFNFGYVQTISGTQYAVVNEKWTFDHGAGSLEGWYATDVSANPGTYFKRITAADWTGHDNAVAAPILAGTASAWVGIYEDAADALCWESGLGYGNNWCQRWSSPSIAYSSGDVNLSFKYFNDTETDFDYSKVLLRFSDGTERILNNPGFSNIIGLPTAPVTYTRTIFASDFLIGDPPAPATSFNLVFEFTADGGYSDEDGSWQTANGPFGLDDIALTDGATASFNYEANAQGFVASTCGGFGTFFGIANVSNYNILDPCACELAGNVLKFHDDQDTHPTGQHVMAISPPARRSDTPFAQAKVFADWDMYADMPQANGVFYRPGFDFFPYVCPQTNANQWSGRIGQDTFFYAGDDPTCFLSRNAATDWGAPADAQLYKFIFEVYSSCDAFGIPSTTCTGITNATPIVDNVQLRMVAGDTPAISFETGCVYIDGFPNALTLSTTSPGNADITYDLRRDNPTPDKLGDSLLVKGPLPTSSTRWEAKMWWRIRREGPGQAAVSGYTTWKTAIADGLSIVGATGQFTFGRMDSIQQGTQVARNKFLSEFREDDDDFQGEVTDNNEMIRDGILAPGTKIQYFCTSNYTSPANAPSFYLPDTTGKNYLEFEILPSYRNVSGVNKFPCILCVDLNTGNQFFVENALNVVLNNAGPGAPIPDPTTWDRYDYNDASSNWNAPMARSVGGNNGCTLPHLLGYRQVILYTGASASGAMETADFTMYSDWLSAIVCNGNSNRQGFIGNGDNLATILAGTNPVFLVNALGAVASCDAYNTAGCGPSAPADESYCVRVLDAAGSPFDPVPASGYDVWGNWCPQKFIYDKLGTTAGGVGNRVYNDYDRSPALSTNYAQVVKSVTTANSDNYRSVLDGYAYSHMSTRDVSLECVGDSLHIVPAVYSEIREALVWIYGGLANIPSFCESPCSAPNVDDGGIALDGGAMDRLYQNSPNPFNPRTTLKFSLASEGPAKLLIFDVNGRKVKTLVDANLTAGSHEIVWDGLDDFGHKVAAGVFWSQLTTNNYTSNKKMVVMR